MTREEQIIQASEIFSTNDLLSFGGACEELDYGFREGAKWADITMIEKACKWLLKGGYFVNNTETINDFKQAMEK